MEKLSREELGSFDACSGVHHHHAVRTFVLDLHVIPGDKCGTIRRELHVSHDKNPAPTPCTMYFFFIFLNISLVTCYPYACIMHAYVPDQ